MATIIEQNPLYKVLPVGQDVIFSVSNSSVVSTFTKVKFIAEVHISSGLPPNPSLSTGVVGTFKTTPNNAGVGMFDFRPVIESFVKSDNTARKGSVYKLALNTTNTNVPMHLIDKYSGNINTIRYLVIQFKVEYIDLAGNLQTGQAVNSNLYQVFNGYLKHTDGLSLSGNNFGYDLSDFSLNAVTKNFLTNAPTTQYANLEDYGTVGMLMSGYFTSGITFDYYDESGSSIGSETTTHLANSGGFLYPNAITEAKILFAGIFPANLQNWSTMFQGLLSTISYYKVTAVDSAGHQLSERYTINVNCPNLKGYEPVRLTWLNQWGTWDYYTFTMKSTKMISTKGSTYQQLGGSWNEKAYRIDSFKGGKKSFRVNATEKVTMNTDFVSESESEWFEDLINSPEVYILEGFKTDTANSALNKYVTPVRLTTSSYTKKTVANDKLMQYTFEVEKAKTLRTQSV